MEEALHTHGLYRNQFDRCSISRHQDLRVVLQFLACAAVKFLLQLREPAGDVGSVAVQHWGVASFYLPWMV